MEVRVNRIILSLLAAWLWASSTTLALEITSVAPNLGAPGTVVILSGGPFSSKSRIFLGEQPVPASRTSPTRLEFAVPLLPAGSYSLTVQEDADTAVEPFFFEVLARTPQITAVIPDNVDYCADAGTRQVQIVGEHFLPGTVVMLNGSAVSSRLLDSGHLEFSFPELPAGVYGIEVRNTDGATSLPHSLWINSIPEIVSVERGEEFVNHYDMLIHGHNFFYNSILVVREPSGPIASSDFRQRTIHATRGTQLPSGTDLKRFDQLLYLDCGTLVYQRYPLDMLNKDLVLQIINPDGQKTAPYHVTLP